mgnify:CR=1 FL=1
MAETRFEFRIVPDNGIILSNVEARLVGCENEIAVANESFPKVIFGRYIIPVVGSKVFQVY